MFAILLAFLSGLVILVIYFMRKNRDAGSKVLPGPIALPVVGSSYLMNANESPFVKFTELSRKYGDVYEMHMGSNRCVIVSGVDIIRSVLMTQGKSFGGRPNFVRFNKLFGDNRQNSLAFCDWCNLQIKRRNIARKHCDPKPYSNFNALISEVGNLEFKELVNTIKIKSVEAEANGTDINIKPIIMMTCLNIFAQYMCSVRFDPSDPEVKEVARILDEIFWEINQGYAVDFFPWLLPFYKSHMDKLSNWSKFIRNFILKRVINDRDTGIQEEDNEQDFTDALLKNIGSSKDLSRDAILYMLEDFLGGSSAVGNMIMLMLANIAKNKDIAAKIREEVDNLTAGERPVTALDSDALPYTMATVRETLRYQSSPIVPHVASEDTQIDGYPVQKGTVVIINNYKLNMDEELWKEPTKFNPERFLDKTYVDIKNERRGSDHDSGVESENEDSNKNKITEVTHAESDARVTKKEIVTLKQNLKHFMPFSIGKRTCLGQGLLVKYSLQGLATIIQNFDISCKRPELIQTFDSCIALPPDTFGLTLTPRKH